MRDLIRKLSGFIPQLTLKGWAALGAWTLAAAGATVWLHWFFWRLPAGTPPAGRWEFVENHLEPLATLAAFIAAAVGGALLWRQIKSQDEQLKKLTEDVETAQKVLALERFERLDARLSRVSDLHQALMGSTSGLLQMQKSFADARPVAFDLEGWKSGWDQATTEVHLLVRHQIQSLFYANKVVAASTAYMHWRVKLMANRQENLEEYRSQAGEAIEKALRKAEEVSGILFAENRRLRAVLKRDDELLLR